MLKFCTRKYIFFLLISLGITVSSCRLIDVHYSQIYDGKKVSAKKLYQRGMGNAFLAMDTIGSDKVLTLASFFKTFYFGMYKFKTKKFERDFLVFHSYQNETLLDYRRNKNIITVLSKQTKNNMIFKRVFNLKKKKIISIEVINSTIDDKDVEFEEFTKFEGRKSKYNIGKLLKFSKGYYYPKDILKDIDDPEETTFETYFSDKKQAMLISLPLENNQFAIKVFDEKFKMLYTKRIDPTDFITIPPDVDIDDIEYKILNRSLQEDGTLYLTMSLDIEDLAQSNLVVAKISKDEMNVVKYPENFHFTPKSEDFEYDDYLEDRLNNTKTIVENNKFHIYCYHNYDNEFMGITHNAIDFDAKTCSETVQMDISNDMHTYYNGDDGFYPSYINSLHKLDNGNILIEFERDNFESDHIIQGNINTHHKYDTPVDHNTKGGLSLLMLDKDLNKIWHTFLRSSEDKINKQIYTYSTNFLKPNSFEKNAEYIFSKETIEGNIKTNLNSDFNSISKVKIDIKTGKIQSIKPMFELGRLMNISINGIFKLSNGTFITISHLLDPQYTHTPPNGYILHFRDKR